jgi:hypothetical protein
MEITGSMISEVLVELIESARVIGVPSPIHDVELLAGVRVEESQPIF